MPTYFCPHCGSKLFPKELEAGECTACLKPLGEGFAKNASLSQPRVESGESAAKAASFAPAKEWYGGVRFAVWLMSWALLISLIAFAGTLGSVLLREMLGDQVIWTRKLLAIALTFAVIAGGVLYVAGLCLACTAPAVSGARWLAIATLVCLLLSVSLVIGGVGLAVFGDVFRDDLDVLFSELRRPMVLLCGLCAVAGLFCHCFFFRQLCRRLGNSRLGRQFLVFAAVVFLLPLVAASCVLPVWSSDLLVGAGNRIEFFRFVVWVAALGIAVEEFWMLCLLRFLADCLPG